MAAPQPVNQNYSTQYNNRIEAFHALISTRGFNPQSIHELLFAEDIPLLTEVVCTILEREVRYPNSLLPQVDFGTRHGELNVKKLLGVNMGRIPVSSTYTAPLYALSKDTMASFPAPCVRMELLDFLRILRSSTNWDAKSFRLAIEQSEYKMYCSQLESLHCGDWSYGDVQNVLNDVKLEANGIPNHEKDKKNTSHLQTTTNTLDTTPTTNRSGIDQLDLHVGSDSMGYLGESITSTHINTNPSNNNNNSNNNNKITNNNSSLTMTPLIGFDDVQISAKKLQFLLELIFFDPDGHARAVAARYGLSPSLSHGDLSSDGINQSFRNNHNNINKPPSHSPQSHRTPFQPHFNPISDFEPHFDPLVSLQELYSWMGLTDPKMLWDENLAQMAPTFNGSFTTVIRSILGTFLLAFKFIGITFNINFLHFCMSIFISGLFQDNLSLDLCNIESILAEKSFDRYDHLLSYNNTYISTITDIIRSHAGTDGTEGFSTSSSDGEEDLEEEEEEERFKHHPRNPPYKISSHHPLEPTQFPHPNPLRSYLEIDFIHLPFLTHSKLIFLSFLLKIGLPSSIILSQFRLKDLIVKLEEEQHYLLTQLSDSEYQLEASFIVTPVVPQGRSHQSVRDKDLKKGSMTPTLIFPSTLNLSQGDFDTYHGDSVKKQPSKGNGQNDTIFDHRDTHFNSYPDRNATDGFSETSSAIVLSPRRKRATWEEDENYHEKDGLKKSNGNSPRVLGRYRSSSLAGNIKPSKEPVDIQKIFNFQSFDDNDDDYEEMKLVESYPEDDDHDDMKNNNNVNSIPPSIPKNISNETSELDNDIHTPEIMATLIPITPLNNNQKQIHSHTNPNTPTQSPSPQGLLNQNTIKKISNQSPQQQFARILELQTINQGSLNFVDYLATEMNQFAAYVQSSLSPTFQFNHHFIALYLTALQRRDDEVIDTICTNLGFRLKNPLMLNHDTYKSTITFTQPFITPLPWSTSPSTSPSSTQHHLNNEAFTIDEDDYELCFEFLGLIDQPYLSIEKVIHTLLDHSLVSPIIYLLTKAPHLTLHNLCPARCGVPNLFVYMIKSEYNWSLSYDFVYTFQSLTQTLHFNPYHPYHHHHYHNVDHKRNQTNLISSTNRTNNDDLGQNIWNAIFTSSQSDTFCIALLHYFSLILIHSDFILPPQLRPDSQYASLGTVKGPLNQNFTPTQILSTTAQPREPPQSQPQSLPLMTPPVDLPLLNQYKIIQSRDNGPHIANHNGTNHNSPQDSNIYSNHSHNHYHHQHNQITILPAMTPSHWWTFCQFSYNNRYTPYHTRHNVLMFIYSVFFGTEKQRSSLREEYSIKINTVGSYIYTFWATINDFFGYSFASLPNIAPTSIDQVREWNDDDFDNNSADGIMKNDGFHNNNHHDQLNQSFDSTPVLASGEHHGGDSDDENNSLYHNNQRLRNREEFNGLLNFHNLEESNWAANHELINFPMRIPSKPALNEIKMDKYGQFGDGRVIRGMHTGTSQSELKDLSSTNTKKKNISTPHFLYKQTSPQSTNPCTPGSHGFLPPSNMSNQNKNNIPTNPLANMTTNDQIQSLYYIFVQTAFPSFTCLTSFIQSESNARLLYEFFFNNQSTYAMAWLFNQYHSALPVPQVMDLSITILNQLTTNWRDMVDFYGIYVQYKDWQSNQKNDITTPSSSTSPVTITHTLQICPSPSALFFKQEPTIQWADNASFGVTQIVDSYYNLSFSTHPITKRILKTRHHPDHIDFQSDQQMASFMTNTNIMYNSTLEHSNHLNDNVLFADRNHDDDGLSSSQVSFSLSQPPAYLNPLSHRTDQQHNNVSRYITPTIESYQTYPQSVFLTIPTKDEYLYLIQQQALVPDLPSNYIPQPYQIPIPEGNITIPLYRPEHYSDNQSLIDSISQSNEKVNNVTPTLANSKQKNPSILTRTTSPVIQHLLQSMQLTTNGAVPTYYDDIITPELLSTVFNFDPTITPLESYFPWLQSLSNLQSTQLISTSSSHSVSSYGDLNGSSSALPSPNTMNASFGFELASTNNYNLHTNSSNSSFDTLPQLSQSSHMLTDHLNIIIPQQFPLTGDMSPLSDQNIYNNNTSLNISQTGIHVDPTIPRVNHDVLDAFRWYFNNTGTTRSREKARGFNPSQREHLFDESIVDQDDPNIAHLHKTLSRPSSPYFTKSPYLYLLVVMVDFLLKKSRNSYTTLLWAYLDSEPQSIIISQFYTLIFSETVVISANGDPINKQQQNDANRNIMIKTTLNHIFLSALKNMSCAPRNTGAGWVYTALIYRYFHYICALVTVNYQDNHLLKPLGQEEEEAEAEPIMESSKINNSYKSPFLPLGSPPSNSFTTPKILPAVANPKPNHGSVNATGSKVTLSYQINNKLLLILYHLIMRTFIELAECLELDQFTRDILLQHGQQFQTSYPPPTGPLRYDLFGFFRFTEIFSIFPVIPPFLLSLIIQSLGLATTYQQCPQIEPSVGIEARGAIFDLYLQYQRQQTSTSVNSLNPFKQRLSDKTSQAQRSTQTPTSPSPIQRRRSLRNSFNMNEDGRRSSLDLTNDIEAFNNSQRHSSFNMGSNINNGITNGPNSSFDRRSSMGLVNDNNAAGSPSTYHVSLPTVAPSLSPQIQEKRLEQNNHHDGVIPSSSSSLPRQNYINLNSPPQIPSSLTPSVQEPLKLKKAFYSLYTSVLHPYWVLDLIDLMLHKLTQSSITKATQLATRQHIMYSPQVMQSPSARSLLASPLLLKNTPQNNTSSTSTISSSIPSVFNNDTLEKSLPVKLESILDIFYPIQCVQPNFSNMLFSIQQYQLLHHNHQDFNAPSDLFQNSYDFDTSVSNVGIDGRDGNENNNTKGVSPPSTTRQSSHQNPLELFNGGGFGNMMGSTPSNLISLHPSQFTSFSSSLSTPQDSNQYNIQQSTSRSSINNTPTVDNNNSNNSIPLSYLSDYRESLLHSCLARFSPLFLYQNTLLVTDLRVASMLLCLELHFNHQRIHQVDFFTDYYNTREEIRSMEEKRLGNITANHNNNNKNNNNTLRNRKFDNDTYHHHFDQDHEDENDLERRFSFNSSPSASFNNEIFVPKSLPSSYTVLIPMLFQPSMVYLNGIDLTLRDYYHRYDQSPNRSILLPISSQTHSHFSKWLAQPLYYQQICANLQYHALLLFSLSSSLNTYTTPITTSQQPLIESMGQYNVTGKWWVQENNDDDDDDKARKEISESLLLEKQREENEMMETNLNSSSGWLWKTLLVGISTIAAVGAGYYYLSTRNDSKDQDDESPTE